MELSLEVELVTDEELEQVCVMAVDVVDSVGEIDGEVLECMGCSKDFVDVVEGK